MDMAPPVTRMEPPATLSAPATETLKTLENYHPSGHCWHGEFHSGTGFHCQTLSTKPDIDTSAAIIRNETPPDSIPDDHVLQRNLIRLHCMYTSLFQDNSPLVGG